jgi:hypothetical protein
VIVKDPHTGAIHMNKLPLDLSSVTTIAVDLAKHIFQVHGCDASGKNYGDSALNSLTSR